MPLRVRQVVLMLAAGCDHIWRYACNLAQSGRLHASLRQIRLVIRFNRRRCVVLRRGRIGPAQSRGRGSGASFSGERMYFVSHDTSPCGLRQLHFCATCCRFVSALLRSPVRGSRRGLVCARLHEESVGCSAFAVAIAAITGGRGKAPKVTQTAFCGSFDLSRCFCSLSLRLWRCPGREGV
eukprot:441546-Prymnesium_polylepis.1